MALFGNRNRKPDDTPFLAPEPEGPEEVSRKFQRSKEGRSGAAKRTLLEKSGLEELSPARRFLISAVATAEIGMIGMNFFTDANLPAGWLFGAAIPLLALLLHKNEGEEPSTDEEDIAADPPKPHEPSIYPFFHTESG